MRGGSSNLNISTQLATMDLQICSACCSPTPAGMSIRLKTCQHSFCVPCLKYALMDQGSPDLQCPYPVGTFECGISPNEEEVQYVLEFEEEAEEEQVKGERCNETIEELEKSLDRVLTIGADEFPGEPEEELPNVRGMNAPAGLIVIDDAVIEENQSLNPGSEQLQGADSNDVVEDSSDPLRYDMNLFPNFGSDLFEGEEDIDNTQQEFCKIASEESLNDSEFKGELIAEINAGLGVDLVEQESPEVEKPSGDDILIGTNEIEPPIVESAIPMSDISSESSNPAVDVSKGAIPKVCQPTNQESSLGNDEIQQNPSEDLALALKLQEEESKIDMDLLLAISDANLPPNLGPFECPVCYGQFKPYEGVTLTFCFHSFCKPCLSESVKHSDELEVTCPALVDGNTKCSAIIQDGAIRDLLTEEDFQRFQDRCLQTAEAVIPNTVHCLTPNCRGWVELIGEVESFDCLICDETNCVSCKVIHDEDESCEEYQANIQRKDDEIKSEARLRTMVETREGMRCPKCGVMITKIEGCDFMTCTTCKTGICWPTRGPRWGPAGQGDISGGCRCKVDNGKRCHPDCEGCH